jgi:hypothetical protein
VIVQNDRKRGKMAAPFRSVGMRIIACIRCEHYRRTISTIPHRRLWGIGLCGCCIRPEGLCQEVRV